jgi:hypothetical protein
VDVCFRAHYGLKSDIVEGPKSAIGADDFATNCQAQIDGSLTSYK